MFARWGWAEWLIVLVIVLVVFGVGRLPEIGGAVGKAIREFRSQSKGDEDKPKETEEPEASKDA